MEDRGHPPLVAPPSPPGYPPPGQPMPGHPPTRPHVPRPNRQAWVWATAVGGATLVGLLMWSQLRDSGGSVAYDFGRVAVFAGVPAVVVGVAATHAARRWRGWWYVAAIMLPAVLWFVLLEVLPDVVDDARAEATGEADRVVVTPNSAGPWQRVEGPAFRERRRQFLTVFVEEEPALAESAELVYAEYRHRDGQWLALIAFNAGEGPLRRELRDDADASLRDAAAGARVEDAREVDPGELGGVMRCGTGDPSLGRLPVCLWADASTPVQVYFSRRDLSTNGRPD